MVAEVVETPTETVVDPASPAVETEVATEVVADAAPEQDEAAPAVQQVEVTEPDKPDYMTRADWEREKAEVSQRAASDALEQDRRRRQTENARRATQEKRDAEIRSETADIVRATFSARLGIDPASIPDDLVDTAIGRAASRRAEGMSAATLDTVDQAWDYLTAPAYGKSVDLDESFESAAKRLGPKVQHLVDQIRPAIEAKAREGYVKESDLPKRFEAMQAAKNAKSREGQEELKRVDGTPSGNDGSLANWETRVAHQGEAGYPHLSETDWAEYRSVRRASGL